MNQRPSEPQPRTIDEVIADLRLEEQQQLAAATIAMKTVHAAGPSTTIDPSRLNFRRGNISRGPGAIAKASPSGEFIGWYREGQTRGRPSSRMPLEQDLERASERYYRMLRDAVPRTVTNAILSARSALTRKGRGLAPLIFNRYLELVQRKVPRSQRSHKITMALGCHPDYVRRVLRAHGIRSGPPRKNKTRT